MVHISFYYFCAVHSPLLPYFYVLSCHFFLYAVFNFFSFVFFFVFGSAMVYFFVSHFFFHLQCFCCFHFFLSCSLLHPGECWARMSRGIFLMPLHIRSVHRRTGWNCRGRVTHKLNSQRKTTNKRRHRRGTKKNLQLSYVEAHIHNTQTHSWMFKIILRL